MEPGGSKMIGQWTQDREKMDRKWTEIGHRVNGRRIQVDIRWVQNGG